MNRRGLGKGLGTGYKNLAPMDSHIHSLSAKGQKTYAVPVRGLIFTKARDEKSAESKVSKLLLDRDYQRGYKDCKSLQYATLDKNWLGGTQDLMKGDIDATDENTLTAKGSFQAGEVLRQLGGNRFIAMTGAKNFVKDDDKQMIGFKIGRNAKNVNYVRITLNSMDTYDVEFLNINVNRVKTVSKVEGVYNDQLQEIFTENTGMATRLFARGLTSAQRHNRRMDKIMEQARELPSSLNKYYWRQGKVVKRTKGYKSLNAQTVNKPDYTKDVLNRIGKRSLHYQSKERRDEAFKILKDKGISAKKTTSSSQEIHPEYIEDYKGEIETGFGNTMYRTYFKKLYNIEVL